MMRVKLSCLTILLCFVAGAAQATFELRDPAGEVYEEKQELKQETSEEKPASSVICTMDSELDACICVNKQTGEELPVTHEQCVEITSNLADPQDP